MKLSVKSFVLLALMLLSAVLGAALRPTVSIADQRGKLDLEHLIPKQFGDWHELQQSTGQIVNPQQSVLLQKLYTQTLSRTYLNSTGSVVMLSIAYGANQSDSVALHYPEVCYPTQGFQLLASHKALLPTAFGTIAAKRLMMQLGNRYEPVTYWSTLGNQVVQGGLDTKLTQLSYGFKGLIPDGLIFRVSSINKNEQQGYDAQALFAQELVAAISVADRQRLAGLKH
jgi:EpsI family protein